MPLSSLPKAYGLPEVSNEHFVICLTDPKIKATSDHFHQGRCSRQTQWVVKIERNSSFGTTSASRKGENSTLKNEMIEYCKQDVQILRSACVLFRNMYFYEFNFEPFKECMTIASTCMRVFRKIFSKENEIGLIGNGYRGTDKQSPKHCNGYSGWNPKS